MSSYLTGAHLPQPTSLNPLHRILMIVGENGRVRQWEEALLRVRRTPGKRSAPPPAPYPGLRSFQPEDAALFHGREAVTAEIVRRVQQRAADGGGPLIVVGASGAGKSSLLRAGVIPALGGLGFETELMVPSAHALATLEACAEDPPEGMSRAVIVDQFEDSFTRGPAEVSEQQLVDALEVLGARTVAVLGMRADFYPNALLHPYLSAALQNGQIIVRPMTSAELRRAIVNPARQLGYDVEPSLVEVILRDLNPRTPGEYEAAAHDPGALPFLSHALHSAWERSHGRKLSVEAYLSAGGVDRSIANAADEVFGELTEPQQDCARRLLLRLIRTGDETVAARRSIRLVEIEDRGGTSEANDTHQVLDAFVAARLLTISNDHVEITHGALLNAWPRLRDWIDAYRDWMRPHRRITEAANAWNQSGRDPDSLYRGRMLEVARDWVEDSGFAGELNQLETDFYKESQRAHHIREERERRRVRLRNRLTIILAILVIIAGASSVFALQVRRENARNQQQALSRTVADESGELRAIDVSLSMQLALAAYRISPTPEARAALLSSTDVRPGTRVMLPGDALTAMTAGGANDDVLATGTANGPIQLWDVESTTHVTKSVSLPGPGGTTQALAFNRAGSLLVDGGASSRIDLWDTANPAQPKRLPPLSIPGDTHDSIAITSIAIDPASPILAVGTSVGEVLLWNIADPAHPSPLPPLTGLPDASTSLAFSTRGQMLAAGAGSAIQLWNMHAVATSGLVTQINTDFSAGQVLSVALSPDLKTLAVGVSEAHSTLLWNIADPAHPQPEPPLTGPTSWVNTVAFSPDGTELAAGSSDGMVWIYKLATGQLVTKLPHPRPVDEIDYRPDGSLISFADDGTVRSWGPTSPVITSPTDTIFALDFDHSGREMVIGDGSNDDTETLWNVTNIQQPKELGIVRNPSTTTAFSGSGALTPNGRTLAVGDLDGTVQLWNVANPEHPTLMASPKASRALIESVTISNGGTILAVTDDVGTTVLYNITNPTDPRPLATVPAKTPGSYTYQAVFSSKDKLLVVASSDNHAYLWNIANPRHPLLDATLGGFTAAVYTSAFLGDDYLAVGSADGTVRIWNITDQTHPVPVGSPLTGPIGYIYDLAYDPHTHLLADPGSTDGSIWLWDVTDPANPTLFADLTGPSGGVLASAFNPNGGTLVAGGHDHTVHLWNTDIDATESWICSITGQDLTPQEWIQYVPGAPYNPPCPSNNDE